MQTALVDLRDQRPRRAPDTVHGALNGEDDQTPQAVSHGVVRWYDPDAGVIRAPAVRENVNVGGLPPCCDGKGAVGAENATGDITHVEQHLPQRLTPEVLPRHISGELFRADPHHLVAEW